MNQRKHKIAAFALTAAALALLYIFGGGLCIFRLLTGIPCPGCGMTRALAAVLRGDAASAFSFHPLWWTLPLLLLLLLHTMFPNAVSRVLSRLHIPEAAYLRAEQILSLLLLAAFIAVFVIRILGGWDGIHPV